MRQRVLALQGPWDLQSPSLLQIWVPAVAWVPFLPNFTLASRNQPALTEVALPVSPGPCWPRLGCGSRLAWLSSRAGEGGQPGRP